MKRKVYLPEFSKTRASVRVDYRLSAPPPETCIAIAYDQPKMGATFLPHLKKVPKAGLQTPGPKPHGIQIEEATHANGKATGVPYLDNAEFLGGREKSRIWIGTLAEAQHLGLVRPVFITLEDLRASVGYVPAKSSRVALPDRIAVLGLTDSGRVETHRKIPDGRNATMFKKVAVWFSLSG